MSDIVARLRARQKSHAHHEHCFTRDLLLTKDEADAILRVVEAAQEAIQTGNSAKLYRALADLEAR